MIVCLQGVLTPFDRLEGFERKQKSRDMDEEPEELSASARTARPAGTSGTELLLFWSGFSTSAVNLILAVAYWRTKRRGDPMLRGPSPTLAPARGEGGGASLQIAYLQQLQSSTIIISTHVSSTQPISLVCVPGQPAAWQ